MVNFRVKPRISRVFIQQFGRIQVNTLNQLKQTLEGKQSEKSTEIVQTTSVRTEAAPKTHTHTHTHTRRPYALINFEFVQTKR